MMDEVDWFDPRPEPYPCDWKEQELKDGDEVIYGVPEDNQRAVIKGSMECDDSGFSLVIDYGDGELETMIVTTYDSYSGRVEFGDVEKVVK